METMHFFHSAIEFIFEDKNSLHFWGPNERFGTHEKLSWGARYVKLAPGVMHCGYTLEPPRRGGSNEYPQCMFWKIRKLGITLQTFVFLYRSGVYGGIHFTDMFS